MQASVSSEPYTCPEKPTLAVPPVGPPYWLPAAGTILAAVGFVYWRAWICDDAFITFRHVANCLAGYGPVFNPGERVQAFSHPLWFLLLLAGGSLFDLYAFTVVLSLALTAALAAVLAYHLRRQPRRGTLLGIAAFFLLSSPAFVEYQTSGLENSLTDFLIVALSAGALFHASPERIRPWVIALGCAFVLTNRLDHALLCVPPLIWVGWTALRRPRFRKLAAATLALMPAGAWYSFATLYYGSPVPNTAYAKLAEPLGPSLARGSYYLYNYASCEPTHAALSLLAMTAAGWCAVRELQARQPGAGLRFGVIAGAWLHLGCVMAIGGDYMRGRFVVSSLVLAAVLGSYALTRLPPSFDWARWATITLAWGVPLAALLRLAEYLPVGPMTGFQSLATQDPRSRWLLLIGCCGLAIAGLVHLAVPRPGKRIQVLGPLTLGLTSLLAAAGWWALNWPMAGWLVGGLLFSATLLVCRREPRPGLLHWCTLVCLAGFSIARPYGRSDLSLVINGISDEYGWYCGYWGDSRFRRTERERRGEWWNFGGLALNARRYAQRHGPITIIRGSLGFFSYDAGPDVHVIDLLGLADAFVARCSPKGEIRTGHVEHDIPLCYLQSRGAINLLPHWEERLANLDPTLREDAVRMAQEARWTPDAAALRDQVQLVVSGHLLSTERLRALPGYVFPRRLGPSSAENSISRESTADAGATLTTHTW